MDASVPQTVTNATPHIPDADIAAFVAFDWSDKKHAVHMKSAGAPTVDKQQVDQTPEALSQWCTGIVSRYPDKKIAIIIEGNRTGLIYHLMNYPAFVIYLINPKAAAKYREAIYPNGSKTDPIDADLLLDFLLHHRDRLRVWIPDTVETRILGQLAEDRRSLVDWRTGLLNALTARLKQVYPQVLEIFDKLAVPMVADFLRKWPSLEAAQKATPVQLRQFFYGHNCRGKILLEERLQIIAQATPMTHDRAILTTATKMIASLARQIQDLHKTIASYDEQLEELTQAHPKAPIFQSLPGAGKVLVPRLTSALGSQSDRWLQADDLLRFTGVAPIEIASGKQYKVAWRWNCPRFLRQIFVEYANSSLKFCSWAQSYYDLQKSKGKKHHQAIRALAFKWIRIIWKLWKENTPYVEAIYLQSLERKRLSRSLPPTNNS